MMTNEFLVQANMDTRAIYGAKNCAEILFKSTLIQI